MPRSMVAMVLCAALLHVGWNAVVKTSRDRLLVVTHVAGSAALVSAVALVFLPFPRPASWIYVLLSAAVHTGYFLFLLRAYQHGDLSQVYPIARGTAPLLVLALAFVVAGEVPHRTALWAMLLIIVGIMSLAFRGGRRVGAGSKAVAYALGTAMFIAVYTVVDGLGARLAGSPHGYTASLFVLNGLMLVVLLYLRRRPVAITALVGDGWKSGAVAGMMSLVAYWLVIWALSLAPMAPVAALRETSVIFAALLGAVWLKEPFGRWSVASAALVVAGIVLLQAR